MRVLFPAMLIVIAVTAPMTAIAAPMTMAAALLRVAVGQGSGDQVKIMIKFQQHP